jgi:hypothetical protein
LLARINALRHYPSQQRAWFASAATPAGSAAPTNQSPDAFFYGSHLARQILDSGLRQIFLPASSLLSPPIARQVSIHLFVISDHALFPAVGEHTFDWKR